MSSTLYNVDILRLAATTADFPRLSDAQASAEKRSPICGSRIIVDVCLDNNGRIINVGAEVRACALGQASAALMAQHAVGHNFADVEEASAALGLFLKGASDTPGTWPGLSIFGPARAHSARHASIRIAFEALAEAAAQAAR
ncbi:MAG: iron-sulfur cluster assembly scaffold protein [Sphingomonadaceae bacterium]